MAGLMSAWARPDNPEAGPSERKKIPKVAVYVSGAAVSPLLSSYHAPRLGPNYGAADSL